MARNRSSLATATGLLLLTLLYAGLYLLYRQAEPLFPAEPDIDNYSAALAQHEQPALFQRDPAFADGLLTGMLWDGAYLYMRLFQVLHQAFPEDVSRQLALLHIIPSALSLLSFYWLLRGFHLPRVTATLLATAFSLWLLLLFYPGIPSLYYFALTPLLLGALWRYVFAPALHGQALWLPGVALLGAGIGLSPYLVNSVNGLAFNLLTLLLAGLLWLLRRLPLPAFVALLVGLLPALALTSLGGGTGGTGARLTAEAVHLWSQTLQLPSVQPAVYAALYMAIILTGLAAWRTGQRVVKLLFITSSGVLWIMVYGNIVAVLLLYLVLKTWQRRDEPLDAALAVAVSAGVFIGPPLLWIVHEVWSLTQWHTLLFIAWQMYRFHFIGYFIVVLLLARLTLDATRAIPDVRLQWLTQAGLAALIVLQPSRFVTLTAEIETLVLAFMVALLLLLPHARHSFAARPVPLPRLALLGAGVALLTTGLTLFLTRGGLFPGAGIALLLAVVLFLVALLWGMAVGRRGRWIAGGLSAVLLLTVAGFFNGWQPPRRLFQTPVPYLHLTAAQVQADRARGADEQARRSAFIDVAGWIRASTPPDSLFHFIGKQNEFFRYMTRRSLLYSWMDALVGVLNPATVADNSRLVLAMQSIDLYGSSKILEVLDDYGVDYLLAGPIEPPIQPVAVGDRLLSTSVLYRNSHYTVYDFQAQPLADVPPVFEFGAAWHLVHQDLWDGPPVYAVCSPINVYTVWQPLPGSLAAAGDIEYYLSVILQNEAGTLIKVEQLLARHTPAAPPVPVNHNTRFEVPCTAAPGDYQVVLALAAWDTQTQTAQPLTVPGLGDYVYLRTITIGTPGAGTVQR